MGKVANGITTVHLAYVREQTGHALIDAWEWTPAARNVDPVTSAVMGLASEVYGACTELREYLEDHDQAYVLRVRSTFRLVLGGGGTLTCKQGGRAAGQARLRSPLRRDRIQKAIAGMPLPY